MTLFSSSSSLPSFSFTHIASLPPTPSALAHDCVLINRLRIGLTRLTNSYLLLGDDQPECGTCQCPLTVKHILIESVDLNNVRNKYFVVSSMKDLFENVTSQSVVDFIKETHFYKQL